jgi:hypothetical protein
VFDVPDSFGLDNVTLRQALSFKGGFGTLGAARILLRAAVAALLNSAHPDVDYPRTPADVIAAVNAALASKNRSTMLSLATELDADNNLGCPLNGNGASTTQGVPAAPPSVGSQESNPLVAFVRSLWDALATWLAPPTGATSGQ